MDWKREQSVQVGGGRRAGEHDARVGEIEALADDTGEVQDFGHNHTVAIAREEVNYVVAQHRLQDSAAEILAFVPAPCWRTRYYMNVPMANEQMQAAIKELQDTMVVMAHIEKVQSEHISELVEFRVQSEKLRLRTEENLAEISDKLNGLIGYVAGQGPGARPQAQ